MSKFRAVVVDTDYIGGETFFTSEFNAVKKMGGEICFENYTTEDEIIEGCRNAEIIICCGNPPITDRVLSSVAAGLIIRNGIGVNSVDLDAAVKYRKIICNTPGYCTEELAMHASGLILACLRNIGFYNNSVNAGGWPKGEGSSPRRLSNMTVGLLGFGASARALGKIFSQGFGSRVISHDPYISAEAIEAGGAECVTFDQLLAESDVLSVHVPLNDQTKHIINAEAFRKMKRDATLVNIARGGIVCEKDLIAALQSGEIARAGLDVLEKEPVESDNPLLTMSNVVLTPHSAFYGSEADENSHVIVAELINGYINKKLPAKNIANKAIISQLRDFEIV